MNCGGRLSLAYLGGISAAALAALIAGCANHDSQTVLKFRCAELGDRRAVKDREDHGTETGAIRFGYNRELDTCIYEEIWYEGSISMRKITDLLTGETLSSLVADSRFPDPVLDLSRRFYASEKRLFGADEAIRVGLESAPAPAK